MLPAKLGPHSPVAVATVIALKRVGNSNAGVSIFVRNLESRAVMKV